ncbi:ABC transporter permease [Halovivax cerinus]|uniref:ABC transporter permease n=1 Tax=Halovivax cerinus TaxID=1487865 RepID=A0ABD5NPN3_9EURY|nr:ABC transporter permease [Halovivax cerinus]
MATEAAGETDHDGSGSVASGVVSSVGRIRESKMAMIGLVVTVTMLLLAIVAPYIAPHPPTAGSWPAELDDSFLPPFWESGGSMDYPLGTDQQGRGVLSRILFGLRLAYLQGVAPVLLAASIGVTLGLVSGYFGGWIDEAVSRVIDTVMAIPLTLFAISVLAVIGTSLVNLILVIGVTQWVPYARTIRGQTLSIKNEEFVEAQRASGASHARIIREAILPNTMSSILVIATLNIAQVIVIAAGLTFLGLGVSPPRADLGLMLAGGRDYLTTAWWYGVFPGLALMIVVLGINLLGDGIRDILDPKYSE